MAAPASSPRVRALARELQQMRGSRDISQRELSRRTGISHASISYWENGKRVPELEDLAPILDELRVVGAERARVIELVKNAMLTSNWLAPGFPGMSPALAGVLDCEVTATEIIEWNITAISGLLQIEQYARAILEKSSDRPDVLVEMRMARQGILDEQRERQVEFVVLIHENALYEVMATPAVQAKQLAHLLAVVRERSNVKVRVVRRGIGWHPGLAGAFILYNFADSPSIVHIENYTSSAFLYEPRDVEFFKTAVRTVDGVAMSAEESAVFITEVIGDMEMR